MNVILATYVEVLFIICKICFVGYSCFENKRIEICLFDDFFGYFYSIDLSKLLLIKFVSNFLFLIYLF